MDWRELEAEFIEIWVRYAAEFDALDWQQTDRRAGWR